MRIAFIVQRYGPEVAGGAELHCRWVAEHLAERHEVEVLTTTAADYLTWENVYPPGAGKVNGLTVRRFPVTRRRRPERFDALASKVCFSDHTDEEERLWMEEHGPCAPELLEFLRARERDYDALVFFSYRYWTSYHGLQVAPGKSLLVPTAEHDPVIYLRLFAPYFHLPAAIVYNSPEEKELVQRVSGNEAVPGDVVGTGIERPAAIPGGEVARGLGLPGDYVLYVGRIEREKGCAVLLEHFERYQRETGAALPLALLGRSAMEVPESAHVRVLGVLPEAEKLAVLAGTRVLVMPSRYESLSMVVLEAWMMGRPVLVNGDCEVLRGQVLRSGGGLYYQEYDEFAAALDLLLSKPVLAETLGRQGRAYFESHYSWDVIMAKYERLLARVAGARD